ncbi:cobyrinate a,c-diamide synthase [Nocardia puris]|uniref:Hydrogenobyrinate a,c-diamide synthase n=1 Tax=Nocardia puris TaxID=208602 RepID=A0A366E2N2_9NOCA|nr:cobyrinate a,c-diamide synthase [Nocardia puris]MBF6212549.1 cobyrinate a,c-diamide synthase [Nocardia puris]MBF6369129.1 cobyrinate a,c-diamide synthase [Nocardia puris]MBF6463330.1 cobyrinate a,c-diamide synthase [Nocardia puris]RBO96636.1 hydrogenobyrinic acid a,c-diamide synthase (glutamine-hydrolysing) /cobyrinate a,c-diamide synthase [Nocardia puris]
MGAAPAVVIAAPASGSGKTTLATGLIGALRRAGHRVAPFKVGPDYIDPGYHGLAAGRPGRNLDPVLVGAERVVPLYLHGAAGCDLAVVEGVMGLFDGRIDENHAGPVAEGSTAQVAGLLGAPVVLVVDARGHSQSLAALLHGFATYDSGVRLAGVILNRVGSPRHEQVLRAACARVGLPVFGVLPRMAELEVPSRHLGLVPAVEHGTAAVVAVEAMTDLVAAHVDLDAIVAAARGNAVGEPWDPARVVGELRSGESATGTTDLVRDVFERSADGDRTPTPDRAPGSAPIIAMAGGPAFTFGYAEHRELLIGAGAQVVVFDPLRDELPDDAAGLVLPGGFPEEHAADLAANTRLLAAVRERSLHGMPVHAECAGLLYLTRTLDGHAMAGVVDADAVFGPRLTLGYRDAVALADSALWRAGERVRGHEFHRTELVANGDDHPAWGWHGGSGERVREGALRGNVHASYLHTHPAGNPAAIVRFVAAAEVFARASVRS